MSTLSNLMIDFDDYDLLSKKDTIKILTSYKKSSPSKKYLFKIFKIYQYTTQVQKVILDTFYQISNTKCRYLLTYKRFSFSYKYEPKMKPTFSMKLISSKTLESVLNSTNLLKEWKMKNIILCIFSVSKAMDYLHNHLVIHGNLCPSNIIIDEADQFYICDYGLYPIKKLCFSGKKLFNQIYKDPSMIDNEPSFKTDVYSFGILMCHLFLSYDQYNKFNTIFMKEQLQDFKSRSEKIRKISIFFSWINSIMFKPRSHSSSFF